MTENPIIGEVVSIDNVYIAPVTKDDSTGFTAGAPVYFAPAGEIKYDPKVSTASSAFDGRIMFNYMTEGVSETTLTLSGIAEKIIAQVTSSSLHTHTEHLPLCPRRNPHRYSLTRQSSTRSASSTRQV